MADLTRGEAIEWCRQQLPDFRSWIAPPEGWAWSLIKDLPRPIPEGTPTMMLTSAFTILDSRSEDLRYEDVFG